MDSGESFSRVFVEKELFLAKVPQVVTDDFESTRSIASQVSEAKHRAREKKDIFLGRERTLR